MIRGVQWNRGVLQCGRGVKGRDMSESRCYRAALLALEMGRARSTEGKCLWKLAEARK